MPACLCPAIRPRMAAFVLCVVAVVTIWNVSPGTAEPGRIEGRVRLGIKRTARPVPLAAYASRRITTPGAPGEELANVLVWLKDAPRGDVPAPMRARIRQENEAFVPHVTAVTVGTTVEFPNADPYFHNVFSLSRAATFDLGRYARGESRARRFTRPGIVKVFCHFHSHMSAIVAVFDHPYFAQVGADGTFAIERVPPGRYQIAGWHERAGENTMPIEVGPGEVTRVELIVPIETS